VKGGSNVSRAHFKRDPKKKIDKKNNVCTIDRLRSGKENGKGGAALT